MPMLILTALFTGAFAFTITLWVRGFGALPLVATDRLNRLRGGEAAAGPATGSVFNLKKRANINFGGINLVNSNMTAKWRSQLDRAGLTLNVREFFMLRIGVGLGVAMIAFIFLPIKPLALIGLPIGFLGVGLWLNRRISKRTQKMEAQLIEMLQMLASGLRAGFGLMQALDSSAEQLPAPISVEIRRLMRDTAMGASIEQALDALNLRVGSSDFDIVITAILIQRQVGGNLAEILDNVAHTMRERERIRGEIRTLTSQQRMTGYVIGFIPVGLGAAFMVINPDFMGLMFTDSLGHMMLGAAVVMETIGFLIINKIVNIEV